MDYTVLEIQSQKHSVKMYSSRKLACVLECRHAVLIILHPNTLQNTIKYAKSFHTLKFSLCFILKLALIIFFFFIFKGTGRAAKAG